MMIEFDIANPEPERDFKQENKERIEYELNIAGFSAYSLYHALKLHFGDNNYDFFKYNGGTNLKVTNFQKHKQKWSFIKLENEYNDRFDLIELMVANFRKNPKAYWGQLHSKKSKSYLNEYKKFKYSFAYLFKKEFKFLCEYLETNNRQFSYLFESKNGEHPPLFKFVMNDTICIETFIAIDEILQFTDSVISKCDDSLIMPDMIRTAKRFAPFMSWDEEKIRLTMLELLDEYNVNPL